MKLWICVNIVCFICRLRVKFNKRAMHKTNCKLDYIYSNLWGLNKISSKSGTRYFMTLIDDYSLMI